MITTDKEGNIIVKSSYARTELHLQRIKAILNLVQQRSTEFNDADTVYHALDLVEEMLPSEEQMAKALKG